MLPPSWYLDDDTLDNDYISYDDLLRDVRDYTGVLGFTAKILADEENASCVSTDPHVQELVDEIRDLTRREFLMPAAPWPGSALPAQPLPGAVRKLLSERASPQRGGGAFSETMLFRRPPYRLQQEGEPLCVTT